MHRRELVFIALLVTGNLAFDTGLLCLIAHDGYSGWRLSPEVAASRAMYQGFTLGCIYAQLGALAVCTALFPGSNLRRLLIGTLILVVIGKGIAWSTLYFRPDKLMLGHLFHITPREPAFLVNGMLIGAVGMFYLIRRRFGFCENASAPG